MRTFLFILSILLLTGNLYSQITFSKLYKAGTSGLRIIDNGKANYSFYSTSKDPATGNYLNRKIFTTDLLGGAIDTSVLYIANRNIYGANKVIRINNGFVFSGSVAYPNHSTAFIIFTDSSFNKTKQLIYGDTISNTYTFFITNDACVLNSGDMMFCGQENDTTKQPQDLDMLIIKTDSAGNKLWKKTYSYKMTDRAWFIEPTPDGGAIIGGNSFYGATLQGQLRTYDAVVLKVDSAGNEQWHKVWGNPSLNDFWAVVANTSDGNYLLGTCYATQDTIMNNYNEYTDKVINIIKVDTSGNEIWNKYYDSPKKMREISRMIQLSNGNIVATGRYWDWVNPQYFTSWILLLNNNGDSIWYHEYFYSMNKEAENIIYDIKPTQDGGYICCGAFSKVFRNGFGYLNWIAQVGIMVWALRVKRKKEKV